MQTKTGRCRTWTRTRTRLEFSGLGLGLGLDYVVKDSDSDSDLSVMDLDLDLDSAIAGLVTSLLFRLYKCSYLLTYTITNYNLPNSQLNRLQQIQNSPARAVVNTP